MGNAGRRCCACGRCSGGIAGFGAGLIVIDDPIKNRAKAESATDRDRVWDWFNDDIYTRMEPNAAIILIQTRWHEDDLAGRLLKEMNDGGEQWEVVSLPALAEPEEKDEGGGMKDEKQTPDSSLSLPPSSLDALRRKPGEALCPQLFPVKTLLKYQKKLGTYSFSALYQQRPAPAEGSQFKREWFKNIVDAAPNGLSWKRGYDLAISTKTSADYTASFRCAYDNNGNLYIADGFRSRIDYPEQRRYIVARMNEELDTEHGIESAMHGKAVVQELRTDWNVRQFAFREVSVAGDKLTRALTWLNLAEEGKLFLVRGPWIDAFIDEIVRFPTGRHDDQIDAVSVAVQMLGEFKKRYLSMGF
ncbi:MAG: phage terminase large subunit [Chloracidobacterium sp.]|nr:phage terminase large subunit [Chloracidobacterium sp.]